MKSSSTPHGETDPETVGDEDTTDAESDPYEGRTLKDWLLAPEARTENLVPPRREPPMRPLPEFD